MGRLLEEGTHRVWHMALSGTEGPHGLRKSLRSGIKS